MAKTYYWRVDEFDGAEIHKGNIWSFTTQGAVGNPSPSNGAMDIEQTPVLTWSPGVYGASHEVYFGTDADAVKNANTSSPEYKGSGNLGSESYEPGQLELNTTYYWRIDEINNTNVDSPWKGNVWSFTTANFLIIDDFESYNDLDYSDPNSNRIFDIWIGGWDYPANGALVGDLWPSYSPIIVYSGQQSMPYYYNNSGTASYSEATKTLTYPRDWTENGVGILSLWFYGDLNNAPERMYLALNGSVIIYYNNPDALLIEEWTEWTIDLQVFTDQGVNLANVNSITIGFGEKNGPSSGDSGHMNFDDIRLYRPTQQEPEP